MTKQQYEQLGYDRTAGKEFITISVDKTNRNFPYTVHYSYKERFYGKNFASMRRAEAWAKLLK